MDLNDYIVFNTKVMNQIKKANKNKDQMALTAGSIMTGSCAHNDRELRERRLDLKFTKDGLECPRLSYPFTNQKELETLTLQSPGIYLNEKGYTLLSQENKEKFKPVREKTLRHLKDGVKPKVYFFDLNEETYEYDVNKEIYKLKDRKIDVDYYSIIIDLIENGLLPEINGRILSETEYLEKLDEHEKKFEGEQMTNLKQKKSRIEKELIILNRLKQTPMSAGSKKKKKFRSKRRKSFNKRKARKSRKSRKRKRN